MKVIGHRGALHEALENSSESFARALSIGCYAVELDVWCAKDRSLWVCHDESLERTCKVAKKITELKSEDLSKVRLLNGETLPTLEKALDQLLPSMFVNIEIKDTRLETVATLLEHLHTRADNSKIFLSCFELEPLEFLEKKDSSLQLALLSEENNSYKGNPLSYLKEHPSWFFHPQADRMDYKTIDQLHEMNTTIFPWVSKIGPEDVRREIFWSKMKSFGVHGLCTNYPRELTCWLNRQE